MPATFSEYGVQFLYPDNWQIIERSADDESTGVTIEAPNGMLFSLNRYFRQTNAEAISDQIIGAISQEYDNIETVPYQDSGACDLEVAYDLNYYYLDLLVTTRIMVIPEGNDLLLIQIQAENREFDEHELVFAAMLKSLRDHLGNKKQNVETSSTFSSRSGSQPNSLKSCS